MDEGYIKFHCTWKDKPVEISDTIFESINSWRTTLFKLSLIGLYNNGIGYGNISMKDSENSFIISGSATGGRQELSKSEYSKVNAYNFSHNSINCTGEIKASSESLSHAAIYESLSNVKAVIHIHSQVMWKFFKSVLPTTSETILYGTPEMALGIMEILRQTQSKEQGCIIMGGHEDGILVYGRNIEIAGNYLLELYHHSLNKSAIS